MQKVIITGASSFIGYHLASKLFKENFDIVITGTKKPELYSGIQLRRIKSLLNQSIRFETLDITSKEKTKKFIFKHSPKVWFHLPAWTTDWGSYNFNLKKAFELNILPLKYIYKYLKESGCSGFVLVGSEAEYGTTSECKVEFDNCFPVMPYGFSKLMQTLRVKQLAHEYEIPTRVGRVFTPFGVYENPLKLLPQVMKALDKNLPIELSSCEQQRDYIFIDDLVDGFIKLSYDCKKNQGFEIFNISSGISIKLKTLLIELTTTFGGDKRTLEFGKKGMREGELFIVYGNNNKAKSILDWNPKDPIACLPEFVDQFNNLISN